MPFMLRKKLKNIKKAKKQRKRYEKKEKIWTNIAFSKSKKIKEDQKNSGKYADWWKLMLAIYLFLESLENFSFLGWPKYL